MALAKQPEYRPLSVAAMKYLADRGISKETAESLGVVSTTAFFRKAGGEREALAFPYTNEGEVYASKLRCVEAKDFSCAGAPQTFFGLDSLTGESELVIVEGEMDVLAMREAGIENVVSIPNGAMEHPTNGDINPEEDKKFRYVWNARRRIEAAEKVVLAGDSDGPGGVLMEELARRIGKHKCWRVTWPEGCKDANEALQVHGKQGVCDAYREAARYPVSGLYEADAFMEDVEDLYRNGKGRGYSTGYLDVDNLYTVVPGHLTVVTGIPSSGKSEFIDQLMVNLAERNDWTFAVCSYENEPKYHIAKLVSKRVGEPFFTGPTERMDKKKMIQAADWVKQHFFFIHQADGSMSRIDDILDRLKVAVMRYGIKAAVLDPMNYVERPNDMSETQWVSDTLTKLRLFCQAHDVHLWLVAHPAKLGRGENGKTPVPKGYEISGSANYINKCDFGLTVHRGEEDGEVQLHVWKCRFAWAGKMGMTEVIYDPVSTRYREREIPWRDED